MMVVSTLLAVLGVSSTLISAEEIAKRAAAIAYLAEALPKATAANPDYVAESDGAVSRWRTDEIRVGSSEIEMRESYTQTKDGKAVPGRHEAKFSLADVDISDLVDPAYRTPGGEASRAILFACKAPGCISAKWGGQPSKADKTDISIQDDATRAKLLAAFRDLQATER